MRSIRRTALAALATLASVATVALAPHAAEASTGCDLIASPVGSDAAPGTLAAPLRTAQALLDSLDPGATGCLRTGTYAADTQVRVRTAGVTLTAYPGERPTLRGRLRFTVEATGATVAGLVLDGRNPDRLLGPLIYADRVTLRRNDISNAHTAICVLVGQYPGSPPPRDVLIEGNRIHDCGVLPATNHHHGIYLSRGVRTVIRGNLIHDNADRGIQLYPEARETLIRGNVIDGNGVGLIISGSEGSASRDNLVERNLITNSTIRHNVGAHWQGPIGSGNVVRHNCIWGGARDAGDGGIQRPTTGFVTYGNRLVDPGYVNPAAADYRLRNDSPCAGLLSGGLAWSGQGVPHVGVKLASGVRRVRRGRRFMLLGQLRGEAAAPTTGARATIRVRRRGTWRRLRRVEINRLGRFRTVIRARRTSAGRKLRYLAWVPGAGRSRVVRVRVGR